MQKEGRKHAKRSYKAKQQAAGSALANIFITGTAGVNEEIENAPYPYIKNSNNYG